MKRHVQRVLPDLDLDESFVGEYVGIRQGSNQRDYQIRLSVESSWLVCAGIRSTGLTASLGIGRHAVSILETSGILIRTENSPEIVTRALPEVHELAKEFRNGTDDSITVDGHRYKVTHPLTRFGFQQGNGLAAS